MAVGQQTGLPLNLGVVDKEGESSPATFAQPWFYFFRSLWQKSGAQYSTPQKMVYAEQTGVLEVTFYSVNTGAVVGKVTLT